MSDYINELVLWKPLKITTIVMLVFVVILLPFSGFWAVMMLFAIICLWSRVPCLLSMFTKDLDVVDFFVVMLAINVGGVCGGVFGIFIMLFSRIFGPNEWYLYTIKDGISIMICGFLTPWFYAMTGSVLYTFYIFTMLRWILFLLLTIVLEPEAMGLELSLCSIGILKSYVYNTFIAKTFEVPLAKVFEGGVHFSFGLFAVTLAIIAVCLSIGKFGKWLEKYTKSDSASDKCVQEELSWGVNL
jgi:hypothetical protein